MGRLPDETYQVALRRAKNCLKNFSEGTLRLYNRVGTKTVREQVLEKTEADPERLKRELSKLGEIRAKATATTNVDHKAWARRILGSYEGGCNVTPTTLRLAREALRISV